ncbi:hypothetical protein OF377_00480 [Ureaplasma sp. ES3154-GEN]|uniref:hypothetical protein n=1 Tax=Ureaplasma sp. ES3154-GEN TaxID=2984844 RepID=UPI0021E6F645|nr:hypothetical protein [Ureaplasma sp. ES3154-GEN]MCV3743363.1 hypothetical protein [Ureaplasma sp. ES3154-GEN]
MSKFVLTYKQFKNDPQFQDLSLDETDFLKNQNVINEYLKLVKEYANKKFKPILLLREKELIISYVKNEEPVFSNNHLDYYFLADYFLDNIQKNLPPLSEVHFYDENGVDRKYFFETFFDYNRSDKLLTHSFYLSGGFGSGKTFLTTLLTNTYIRESQIKVAFLDFDKLRSIVYEIYRKNNKYFATVEEMLEQLKLADFFVFDNFSLKEIKDNFYNSLLKPLFKHIYATGCDVVFISQTDYNDFINSKYYGDKTHSEMIKECRLWVSSLTNDQTVYLGNKNYYKDARIRVDKFK